MPARKASIEAQTALNRREASARKKAAADKLREKSDKAAVRIVSMVSKWHTGGKLYAYDGIEAARQVREFLIKQFG